MPFSTLPARRRARRILAAMITLLGLSWSMPAQAADPDPTDVLGQLVATTADILDLLTYDVRTVYVRPDGTTAERTTRALVGVPEIVNVNGGRPDLAVTILPLPDRLRLSVRRLAGAPATFPVQVEAIADLPGGDGPPLGVAYGYDQTDSTAPSAFTTDLRFSIFRLPSKEDLTLTTATSGAPDELTVIGSLFTQGTDGTRTDPKEARLRLSPVPGRVTLEAGISSREANPAEGVTALDETRVHLQTDRSVNAVVTASDTNGDSRRDVVADIQDLPSDLSVGFADETLEETETRTRGRQQIDYTANARIGLVDVTVDETLDGERQQSIHATVEDVPRTVSVGLLSDDRTGAADPSAPDAQVENRVVTYQADAAADDLTLTADTFEDDVLDQQVKGAVHELPQAFTLTRDVRGIDDPETEETDSTQHVDFQASDGALGSLEAGFAKNQPVEFIDPKPFFAPDELTEDDVEPGYAFTDGDNAALKLFGISRAVVDTADPVRVELAARPGPFLARVLKGSLEITGRVLDFPANATVDFSPGREATEDTPATDPFVSYHGATPVEKIRVFATNTAEGQTIFDRVKTVSAGVDDVPTDLDLTLQSKDPDAPPPPDGTVETLVSFDAHGARVGLLEALLTSGPDLDGGFPGDGDGVVMRDLDDVFLVAGRITGLSKAEVTRTSVVGDPTRLRVQSASTTATLVAPHDGERPLLIDLDQENDRGRTRTIVELTDRPDVVDDLTLLEEQATLPDVIGQFVAPTPRKTALRYRASEDSGEMSVCLRRDAVAADFDCSAEDFGLAFLKHGLNARINRIPASLDVCLGSDKLELGRAGLLPSVDCLAGDDELPYNQAALCGPELDFELGCRNDELPVSASLLLRASAPVTVDLVSCEDPEALKAGAICLSNNGASFLRMRDLKVQALRAQLDKPITDGENNDNGYAYFDTQLDGEQTSITGDLLIDPGEGLKIEAEFADKADPDQEFHAERRFVAFQPLLLGVDVFNPVFGFCNRGDASIKLGPLQLANDFCD